MKRIQLASVLTALLWSVASMAQQVVATNTNVAVPPLVSFSGVLSDSNGKPLTVTVAVTFSLYSEPSGGAALWMETQNVETDRNGHYTVMLGSTASGGLPSDIFVAGEAHWLAVQVEGQAEQPRVLLVSAPYALKAADPETLGGLPASALVLAEPPIAPNADTAALGTIAASSSNTSAPPPASSDVTTTGGTVNALPLFVNVGIGMIIPKAALDVAGNGLDTYIGNPGCTSGGFAGIAFGTTGFASGCTNYALVGDGGGNTYLSAPTGSIVFRLTNNGNTAMKIQYNGLVGINTTSPDAFLSVNGTADKPGGGSWGTFSDRRLKTLNGDFNSGLSQILKINPVRYRYKQENAMGISDQEEPVGLVAGDVQKVIPEAVTENSKGYLLVNNDPIIWTMLNAIKEQQREIAALRTQLRKRTAKDALLESRLRLSLNATRPR